MAEEIYEEVVEEVFEEVYEEVSEEVFEEVVEESTGTVNIANNTWYTNWGSDTINITANSDQVVFDMGYALTYEYAFAKACVKIDAGKYESITFTYSEQYQSGNNGLRFGIYDNMYVSDTSGTIAIDQSDWSNSGGSVTINLSGISGMKYVGFVFDGSTYNFNEIIGWNCYRRVEITSIDAKKSVGSDGEASEEEIPEEVVECCFLEYDSNGGSDVSSFETWVEVRSYATITSEIPTRFGHKFLGWSKSSSATSASYVAGNKIYITENTTLYAVWESPTVISSSVTNKSYSASITSAGMKKYYEFTPSVNSKYRFESSGDLDTRVFLYDSGGTQLTSNDDGAGNGRNFRLDYNFTGSTKYYLMVDFWSSSQIGTINFTVKRLYTITYDANGGSGAPSSQTKIHDTSLTLSSTILTRTGYTFLGWSTSSNATSATYSKGDHFTTNADTTLYAVWEKKTYIINYNANGGNGGPSSQTKTHGTNLTLSSTVPTKFGYTFLGWSTPSETSVAYEPGDNFTDDTDTTLYAVWESPTIIASDVTDNSYSVSIPFGGMEKYYEFTPSTDGKYRFESSGDLDTRIYLYNASGTPLDSDDDGGDGGNFLLDYNFTSGAQYYIKVRFYYSSTTGTINFTVKRQGFVYICDSTGEFCPYQAFIYDGSNWNQYTPYIYNGSNWDLYN